MATKIIFGHCLSPVFQLQLVIKLFNGHMTNAPNEFLIIQVVVIKYKKAKKY